MGDSEYNSDGYRSPKISIGATIKSPEILKLVPDKLKTKLIYKIAVKKITFCNKICSWAVRVTQQIYDKAAENYPHALKFALDFYGTQTMCDKAVKTYNSTIKFVPKCYKTQEMYGKAVNRCFLYLHFYSWLV